MRLRLKSNTNLTTPEDRSTPGLFLHDISQFPAVSRIPIHAANIGSIGVGSARFPQPLFDLVPENLPIPKQPDDCEYMQERMHADDWPPT
jgi:hypothetical protein